MEEEQIIKARNKILDLSRDDNRLIVEDWKEEHGDKTLGDCIDDVLTDMFGEGGKEEIKEAYLKKCEICEEPLTEENESDCNHNRCNDCYEEWGDRWADQ